MSDATYVTIAYMWGQTNGHQYRVYAGPQRETAIAHATAEQSDRGGKYGCAVYEYTENGTKETLIHYCGASMHGEDAPFHNHRLDMFSTLGHKFARFAEGFEYHTEPENFGGKTAMVVRERPVKPPQWVKDVYEREQKQAEMLDDMLRRQAAKEPK